MTTVNINGGTSKHVAGKALTGLVVGLLGCLWAQGLLTPRQAVGWWFSFQSVFCLGVFLTELGDRFQGAP